MVADQSALIGDIDILTTDEAMAVNERWVGTAAPESNELLLDRYLAAVRQQPESVAVTFEEKSLTYSQFDSRVNELTRYLLARGIGPECVVAVAITRSVEMLVSIYAVVRAGAAYLPVDPDQPHERIRYALSSADVSLILSTSSDLLGVDGFEIVEVDTLPPGRYSNATIDENELAAGGPDNAAYVLFTSGSTGRPKGVVISHRAIVNRLNWMQSEYSLRGEDVVVQKTPITFDVSVWELFWPLQYGARMVVARPGGQRDPAYLAHLLREHSVTVAHFVPSMLAVFAEEQAVGHIDSIRWLFASGEALPTTTARAAVQALPSTRLVNLYGPTEAAVDVTFHEVTEDDTVVVPIGRPVSGTRVHVLDGRLKPAVPGVIGELYLGGVQLARGYASRADLSAERFVANPFGSGERLYRTGDLVRWNRAGEIEYVGRSDFQVKLRGQRIELGDIEAALLTNSGVSRAVVTLVDDPDVGETIVGYIVCRAGLTLDPDEVRGTAAGALPDYMVPTSIVIMDAFPLGPNGKLDRRALPEPTVRIRPFRPPSTPVEEMIAETFGALLGVERIGLDDDFFSLGGNSLIATRVVARLGVAFGVEISLRTLFEAPSVHALAVRIEHERATGSDAGSSLESSLFGRQPMQARRDRDTPAPLSLAQQRMWFLNRLDPDSAANNVPVIISLEGELDVDALVLAFRDVLARHDILRTVYPDIDGVGYQVVEPLAAGAVSSDPVVLEIEQIDPGEARPRALEMLGGGFDVTAGVPVRAALLRESPQYHVLVVVAHHISVDGFSIGPLTRDLAQAYAARASGQAPGWSRPALQYADFAVWQREILGAEDDPSSIASAQLDYWIRQLAGLPDEIELPTDRPRPAEMSYRGAATSVAVDAVLRRRITALANASGVTPFMVMHGALAVLLARMSDTDDVAIGTPVAGRGSAELDDMIGMFVNTLVLRTQVDSALTFADLLAEVRESDLSAFAHSDVPFERIVDVVDPQRSRGRHPLFQVMYTFQNLEGTRLELGGPDRRRDRTGHRPCEVRPPDHCLGQSRLRGKCLRVECRIRLRDRPVRSIDGRRYGGEIDAPSDRTARRTRSTGRRHRTRRSVRTRAPAADLERVEPGPPDGNRDPRRPLRRRRSCFTGSHRGAMGWATVVLRRDRAASPCTCPPTDCIRRRSGNPGSGRASAVGRVGGGPFGCLDLRSRLPAHRPLVPDRPNPVHGRRRKADRRRRVRAGHRFRWCPGARPERNRSSRHRWKPADGCGPACAVDAAERCLRDLHLRIHRHSQGGGRHP